MQELIKLLEQSSFFDIGTIVLEQSHVLFSKGHIVAQGNTVATTLFSSLLWLKVIVSSSVSPLNHDILDASATKN
jgi:hypothetical protein